MYPDELETLFSEEVNEVRNELRKFPTLDCSIYDLTGDVKPLMKELIDVANVCLFFHYNIARKEALVKLEENDAK